MRWRIYREPDTDNKPRWIVVNETGQTRTFPTGRQAIEWANGAIRHRQRQHHAQRVEEEKLRRAVLWTTFHPA